MCAWVCGVGNGTVDCSKVARTVAKGERPGILKGVVVIMCPSVFSSLFYLLIGRIFVKPVLSEIPDTVSFLHNVLGLSLSPKFF